MFMRLAAIAMASALVAPVSAVAQSFVPYASFPQPAPGSFSVVGGALSDGRLLVWNGADIFQQTALNADDFRVMARGYPGDPAFLAITPDRQTAYLGAGYNNTFSTELGTNGEIYRLELNAITDFAPGSIATTQSAYAGAMLSDSLLIIDAGRADFSGSDLLILDVSGAKSAGQRLVVRKPDWPVGSKGVVVAKPDFAYSSTVTVDFANDAVYAMDGNTRELRRFGLAALIAAFQGSGTLDWGTDGTLIGAAGDYFSGGVAGINPAGNLIIPGSAGFGQPGGVQLVHPGTGVVLDTLDPSGTQEFVSVIYNDVLDVINAFASNTQQTYAGLPDLATVPTTGVLGLLVAASLLAVTGIRRR